LVVFDYSKNTKTTIPSDMKLKIELLEKRTFITETN
jgi:hypothetical protein